MLKKYWDIFGGALTGILLAIIARFKLETVQLYYSVLILMLICVGVFRLIRQEVEKGAKRKHNIIDDMVDGQKSVKALSLAREPTKEGEKIGKMILTIIKSGGVKKIMKKVKAFFEKFKGYIFTGALAVLTAMEMCGGFINSLFGGVFTVGGVAILPIITLGCTAIVGAISNGFSKEQWEKVKALFSRSTTNELVIAEIKKQIKEKTENLAQYRKLLATQNTEREAYESELATLNNAWQAKKEMYAMVPQLASAEDVQLAANDVVNCQAKINSKIADITKTEETIKNLTTMINALKNQL